MRPRSMKPPLLMIAGAKGAVGTTVAASVADLRNGGENVLPWMTTTGWIQADILSATVFSGWDNSGKSMTDSLACHGILSLEQYRDHAASLNRMSIRPPPPKDMPLREQVEQISRDMRLFSDVNPDQQPVFINLLPACEVTDLHRYRRMDSLYRRFDTRRFPDLAYALAAIENGIPVVNFTSNALETPWLIKEAEKSGSAWCGRDGKTGQTYLKLVIASALKARHLFLDGWYSLNILGNEDGRNLSDPRKALGKLANKTDFLDGIMGYAVGSRYGQSTHKVAIEYYPPRGDRKEAWDVIDITGIFGMPMSIRINMQLRDSILAAPMVVDLAVWMTALQGIGRKGLVPELAFFFKKAPFSESPVTFQEQVSALRDLERKVI